MTTRVVTDADAEILRGWTRGSNGRNAEWHAALLHTRSVLLAALEAADHHGAHMPISCPTCEVLDKVRGKR